MIYHNLFPKEYPVRHNDPAKQFGQLVVDSFETRTISDANIIGSIGWTTMLAGLDVPPRPSDVELTAIRVPAGVNGNAYKAAGLNKEVTYNNGVIVSSFIQWTAGENALQRSLSIQPDKSFGPVSLHVGSLPEWPQTYSEALLAYIKDPTAETAQIPPFFDRITSTMLYSAAKAAKQAIVERARQEPHPTWPGFYEKPKDRVLRVGKVMRAVRDFGFSEFPPVGAVLHRS